MNMVAAAVGIFGALVLISSAVLSAPPRPLTCSPKVDKRTTEAWIEERWHETPLAHYVVPNGKMVMVLYGSPSGTGTIVSYSAAGGACIMAMGALDEIREMLRRYGATS